jgi:hypothetical protein
VLLPRLDQSASIESRPGLKLDVLAAETIAKELCRITRAKKIPTDWFPPEQYVFSGRATRWPTLATAYHPSLQFDSGIKNVVEHTLTHVIALSLNGTLFASKRLNFRI